MEMKTVELFSGGFICMNDAFSWEFCVEKMV